MSLTYEEEVRINQLEDRVAALKNLLEGAASKNSLDRLRVLCNRQVSTLIDQVTELNTSINTLIELVRKLQ